MGGLTRSLRFKLPMMRGRDVVAVQRRLRALDYRQVGQPDGLFGPSTERAVRAFQRDRGLQVDGVVGPIVSQSLFEVREGGAASSEPPDRTRWLLTQLRRLGEPHRRFPDSVQWALRPEGVSVEGAEPETTDGEPRTVRRVWETYGDSIARWGRDFGVPVELVLATICTETGGRADARREEPGFEDEIRTPHRISIGLMQTLISTARETLQLDHIDAAWLLEPDNAIRAGTGYIARQSPKTLYDPPVVACAYNAGGVYHDRSEQNRWRMRQYPIGTSHHADRFLRWFNDCFRAFEGFEDHPQAEMLAEISVQRLARRVAS